MPPALRAPVRAYGAALFAVATALLLTVLLRAQFDVPRFLFLFAAVMFAAWYGGLGPALLATALAALGSAYFLIPPFDSLSIGVGGVVQIGMFILTALFISSLNEASRRLAAQLRDQREQLQVTLASIGDAVIVTDAQGRVTFLNQVAQDLTGWRLRDAQGQPLEAVFAIVNEETRTPVASPVSRVLREGVVVGLANHTVLVARGGAELPIDDSAAPIRSADGKTIGVVLVFRDVSARRRAEESQRSSALRARGLAEAMPLVVWTARADGEVDYFNQRWYAYTGMAPDQPLGWGWQAALHPDDLQYCVERWRGAVATGAPYEIQYRWRRADGAYRWHLGRALPVRDQHGAISFWVGTGTDIDDQKQAEAHQRFLAQAGALLGGSLDYEARLDQLARLVVPDLADWCAIHMIDQDGAIRQVALAHSDPERFQIGQEIDFCYPQTADAPSGPPNVLRTGQPELVPAVGEDLLADVAGTPGRLTALRALGVESYMVVPLAARGRTLGTIMFVAGASGRRYDAQDLDLAMELAARAAVAVDNARLYREAQDAIRARDQFLSIASHELKTPLTSLLGYAELLQRRAVRDSMFAERDQRAVRVVVEQAVRLNRLVAALLDISRIETGQLSIERGVVDLGALARQLVEETRQTAEHHRLVFSGPEEPLLVLGDELRLEQVLQNLIQNAIKYSSAGGMVEVLAERRDATACISVRDQGIGIPAHAIPQLFSRFYRAPNAESQNISGMGVGLFVVKEIVTLHGGEVTVTSCEGAGSTFTVCIPLHSAMALADGARHDDKMTR